MIIIPVISFSQTFISGKVRDSTGNILPGVNIYIDKTNTGTVTDTDGNYFLRIYKQPPFIIYYSHVGYETISKIISENIWRDSLVSDVTLKISPSVLPTHTVKAHATPDTIFASIEYNVADFEFYKDKLILLTYKNKIEKDAEVILADEKSTIICSKKVMFEAKELFRDYQGNINVICRDTVFRISVKRDEIFFLSVDFKDFNELIRPCIDTIENNIIFSDYNSGYPAFSYYSFSAEKREVFSIRNIIDKPLMREFRFEYYFLPPKEKLKARRFAIQHNTDKHMVAAAMTGFQRSFYYTPLYAPLYVINDSILIFDHYENKLYYYNEYNEPVDSIAINYHRLKEEKWEKNLLKDDYNNKIYSIYTKNGFYYLKKIDLSTGKIEFSFKLHHKYADNVKVKNDCVYYIYRPFESLQKKFLYREFIVSG